MAAPLLNGEGSIGCDLHRMAGPMHHTHTHITSRPKQCHSPDRHGAFDILTWRHAAAVAAALAVPHPPRMLLQTQGMEHQLMVGNVGS